MAITGVHALLYTSEPDALRALLRHAFALPSVDAHDGWLIFALPPAELGIHPSEGPAHQLSIMCDDIEATISDLAAKGVAFNGSPTDRGFGIGVTMVLPGGVEVLLYEPRHATAI